MSGSLCWFECVCSTCALISIARENEEKKNHFFLCVRHSKTCFYATVWISSTTTKKNRVSIFLSSYCRISAAEKEKRDLSFFFFLCVCEYVHRRGNCSSFAIVYPINTGKPAFYSKACFLSRGCCVLSRKKACCRRIFSESSVCTFHFHFFFIAFQFWHLASFFFFFALFVCLSVLSQRLCLWLFF